MQVIDSKLYMRQIRRIAGGLSRYSGSILVTGATGMIGSCITDVFIEANRNFGGQFKICALSRHRERLAERFSYAKAEPFLCLLQHDMKEPFCEDLTFDYIIHAASNADPRNYALHPVDTLIDNVFGMKNILDCCLRSQQTRILFTSTFEVYGHKDQTSIYQEETEGCIALDCVRSCYPESKRCAEVLLKCYQQEYGVDYVIARLCSIYGPTMSLNDNKAHAEFILNGLREESIVLKSSGLQRRTYCYVMDAVSALLTVLFVGKTGGVYNISNERSIASISEMAAMTAEICHQDIVFEKPTETEKRGYSKAQDCILDNSKLRQLGWKGVYSLQDGLQSTIKILRESIFS